MEKERVIFFLNRRKVSMAISGAILLILLLSASMIPHQQERPVLSYALANRIIVVDPGHGGVDPGAISLNQNLEKDVTLEISRKLTRYLSQAGALVVSTRMYDDDLAGDEFTGTIRERKKRDMARRVELAKKSNADLYISIHTNAETSRKWTGAQVFYRNNDEESKRIAEAIQNELKRVTKNSKREAKGADYFLMKQNRIPTLIIEVGFISNPHEETLLLSDDYQHKLAYAIFTGLVNAQVEKGP